MPKRVGKNTKQKNKETRYIMDQEGTRKETREDFKALNLTVKKSVLLDCGQESDNILNKCLNKYH